MSVEAMAWALGTDPGTPTRKLILIGLANHAHKNGRHAYPSKKVVAEYANCDPKTVARQFKDLRELGFIRLGDQTIAEHIRADKRPTVYDLAMDEATRADWQAAQERGDNVSPRALDLEDDTPDERGDNLSPRSESHGGTPGFQRGDTAVSPEPSVTVFPPNPPPAGGAGCARHTTPAVNCRGCGTTNRDNVRATAQDAAARRRAANDAAIQADRAAIARAASAEQREARAREARMAIAAAKSTTQAAVPAGRPRGR